MNQKTETTVDSCSKHMTKGTFFYKEEDMPALIDSFIERGKLSRLNILADFLMNKKDKKSIELLIKKCNEAGFNSIEKKFN